MEALFDTTSLSRLFVPTVPLIEAFLRGTIVYLGLFAPFRQFLEARFGVYRGSSDSRGKQKDGEGLSVEEIQ